MVRINGSGQSGCGTACNSSGLAPTHGTQGCVTGSRLTSHLFLRAPSVGPTVGASVHASVRASVLAPRLDAPTRSGIHLSTGHHRSVANRGPFDTSSAWPNSTESGTRSKWSSRMLRSARVQSPSCGPVGSGGVRCGHVGQVRSRQAISLDPKDAKDAKDKPPPSNGLAPLAVWAARVDGRMRRLPQFTLAHRTTGASDRP